MDINKTNLLNMSGKRFPKFVFAFFVVVCLQSKYAFVFCLKFFSFLFSRHLYSKGIKSIRVQRKISQRNKNLSDVFKIPFLKNKISDQAEVFENLNLELHNPCFWYNMLTLLVAIVVAAYIFLNVLDHLQPAENYPVLT